MKALIPAAGMGTRMAPVSRVIPKELFPVGRKTAIEHCLAEAAGAGFNEIGIIVSPDKPIIREYLSHPSITQELSSLAGAQVSLAFIPQREPRGLGDAIMSAEEFIGGEPFAMLLPDMLFLPPFNASAALRDFYDTVGQTCMCLNHIDPESSELYGSLAGEEVEEGRYVIRRVSNSPTQEWGIGHATLRLRGSGRTIFDKQVFDYWGTREEALQGQVSKYFNDGEVLDWLARTSGLMGLPVSARPFDVGSWQGYFQAVAAFSSI